MDPVVLESESSSPNRLPKACACTSSACGISWCSGDNGRASASDEGGIAAADVESAAIESIITSCWSTGGLEAIWCTASRARWLDIWLQELMVDSPDLHGFVQGR